MQLLKPHLAEKSLEAPAYHISTMRVVEEFLHCCRQMERIDRINLVQGVPTKMFVLQSIKLKNGHFLVHPAYLIVTKCQPSQI